MFAPKVVISVQNIDGYHGGYVGVDANGNGVIVWERTKARAFDAHGSKTVLEGIAKAWIAVFGATNRAIMLRTSCARTGADSGYAIRVNR